MTITKNITIDKIITKPRFSKKLYDENNSFEVLEDVIQSVVWKCEVVDEETQVKEEIFGTTHFQYPEGEFIPYNQITKFTVLNWLENHPDVEYRYSLIEEKFKRKIEDSKMHSPIFKSFDSLPD